MDGGVSFGGKCALEIVKRGVEPTRHLRGVGSVADDLGEPEDEEGLEASELTLDSDGSRFVDAQARGIGVYACRHQEIADPVDCLHGSRRVVDGGRKRTDGRVGELTESKTGVPNETPFATDQKEAGDRGLVGARSVHDREPSSRPTYSPTPTVSSSQQPCLRQSSTRP